MTTYTMYKDYEIEHFVDIWSVVVDGNENWFSSEEEAKKFIDKQYKQ